MNNEITKDLKKNCLVKTKRLTQNTRFEDLFDHDWEVFVIKKDEVTGQFIGKTACCALARV